jgi:hypothetical protein
MGFRFSLSTVLRFRESVEKREELALQTTQLEIARVRRVADELATKIAEKYGAIERAMQRSLQASLLQLMLSEVNENIVERQDLLLKLEVLQQKRRVQLETYRTAHSGRRMLTDILTQQRNAYEQKQMRAQQKFLDDVFVARSQQK